MLPVTKNAVTSMSEVRQKHTSSDLHDKYGMAVLQWNGSSCTENSSNTNYNRSSSCIQLLKGLEIINQSSNGVIELYQNQLNSCQGKALHSHSNTAYH